VVRTLRAANHDVMAVSEISPRADDVDVMEFAVVEGRMLLTEDKDFGQLVYARGGKSVGVILLRYPARARKRLCDDVINLVEKYRESLTGTFVVMQPGRFRIARNPIN
jgi:predicted nuclease of predicted toxin-antitoxin system